MTLDQLMLASVQVDKGFLVVCPLQVCMVGFKVWVRVEQDSGGKAALNQSGACLVTECLGC